MKVKKGQIIAITVGEYSDYCLRDHLKALKDFDTSEEVIRFRDTGDYAEAHSWDPGGEENSYGSDERFLAWLVRENLVAPLADKEVVEWHIGDHGQLDLNSK